MSSAFKNFFITFVVCLLLFGFVGFKFLYPWLSSVISIDEEETETSKEESNEPSEESETPSDTSKGDTDIDENGKVFTAAITCESESGETLGALFIDSNEKTKRFIYCRIPPVTRVYNDVGVMVPVADMFRSDTRANAITDCVSAMTGIETDYFVTLKRSSLVSLVSMMNGAYFNLDFDVKYVNPKYENFVPVEGEGNPEDYYIFIPAGRVNLDADTLKKLLDYNPNLDGSEYNTLYLNICKQLAVQFFSTQANNVKNASKLSNFLADTRTNMKQSDVSKYLDVIFKYNTYQRKEIDYPSRNWQNAVKIIREADGRYER